MDDMLYFECYSGISGDMAVAALLDLGADAQGLKEVLSGIDAKGFDVVISRRTASGLDCADFDVVVDKDHQTHDHDMEYLYGHLGGHDHPHGGGAPRTARDL